MFVTAAVATVTAFDGSEQSLIDKGLELLKNPTISEELLHGLDSVDWVGERPSVSKLNSKNRDKHVFNAVFSNTDRPKALYNASTSQSQKLKLRPDELESLVLSGSLSLRNKTGWQPFADELVHACGNETAALSTHDYRGAWVACGWVRLHDTFVAADASIRMCTSLLSLGLSEPTRMPIEGTDYKKMPTDVLAAEEASSKKPKRNRRGPGRRTSRTGYPSHVSSTVHTYDTSTATEVDLFGGSGDECKSSMACCSSIVGRRAFFEKDVEN